MVYPGKRLVIISDIEASDEDYVSAYIKEKTATPDKTESTINTVRLVFLRNSIIRVQLAVGSWQKAVSSWQFSW